MTDTLESLRIQKGLTQSALAEKLGTTTGTIGSWEKGKYSPRPKFVPQLAEILGVKPKEIFLILSTTKLDNSKNKKD